LSMYTCTMVYPEPSTAVVTVSPGAWGFW
jgi:hypothetical protein